MLSTLLALLAAAPCGPLDLPTALALAAQRSDEMAIKEADVATAEVDVALARSLAIVPIGSVQVLVGPDPEAHGTVSNPAPNEPNGVSLNNLFQNLGVFERVDVQVAQPLWTWGQLSGARDAARHGLEARRDLVADTLSQIQLRVIQLYWGDALARRFLAIAADVESALDQVDAQIKKALKDEDPSVGPSDKQQVALFRSQLAMRKADAEQAQELARIALAATLALPRDQLRLQEVDLAQMEAKPPNAEQAVVDAEARRPDLRALSAAIEAKKGEVTAKQGALFPQIFVGGEFSYAYAYNRDPQSNPWVTDYFNTINLGVALGLRQDLSIATLLAQRDKARAELFGLERQRDGLRRLIETQAEGAVVELKAAGARSQAAQGGLSAGRGWFHAAGLDFQAGVGDAKALLLAYRGYVESQVAAAQAAYDVLVASARLDQATGAPPAVSPKGDGVCTLQ